MLDDSNKVIQMDFLTIGFRGVLAVGKCLMPSNIETYCALIYPNKKDKVAKNSIKKIILCVDF